MDIQAYSQQFPSDTVPLGDAIEAIVDRMPGWDRKSLFNETGFVQVFRDRVQSIVSRLPLDPEERKPLEIDLAHILYAISGKYDIQISGNLAADAPLRAQREQLVKEGLLEPYTRFTKKETEEVDLTDPRDMELYLEYLYGCAFRGIGYAREYIETLVRLSQLEGGDYVFNAHLESQYQKISEADVRVALSEYDYLSGSTEEKYMELLQSEWSTQEGEKMSDEEAQELLEEKLRSRAQFHIFLNHIVRNMVMNTSVELLKHKDGKRLLELLNDFRDLADPEMYVQASLFSGNTLEQVYRLQWAKEGRELH